MMSMDREHLVLMMEAGYIYMGMQRYKEAREVFEGLTVLAPESDVPWVALGGVAFCEGNFKEAKKVYEKALKMTPESLYAKAYLAETLFFMKEKEESVRLMKEVSHADRGAVGDFARAFLDAVNKGFDPETLSGVKVVKEYHEKKRAKS